MSQIRIDLDDDEDRKVELYKAENRLGSKEEAIKRMIKTFELVSGEKDLYGAIGDWFVQNKGCQNRDDPFSKGYVIDEAIYDGYRPDVIAIRYELTSKDTPSINFYGYIVEVKLREEDIKNDLTKVRLYIKKSREGKLLAGGFNYVSFYVAFAKQGTVDQDLLDICKEDHIGILQLSVAEGKVNGIYEINKPEQIALGGLSHKDQQSPGTFEEAVKNSYLRKLLKDPSGMHTHLIMPKKTTYLEKNKLERIVNGVKDEKARNTLNSLLNKLKQSNLKINVSKDNIVFKSDLGEIKIRPTSAYFNIETSWDKRVYRIYSSEELLEGSGTGNLAKSSSNLDELIKRITDNGTLEKPKVLVIGIGGAGNNMVNHIAGMKIDGMNFAAVNTDKQNLDLLSNVSDKLFLWTDMLSGLGAGGNPELGEKAALANKAAIEKMISGYSLVFLCAGLGGGTGSGATAVISELAKEKGIHTIAIVSMPFSLEKQRMLVAKSYLSKLEKTCDNVIVLENDRLAKIMPDKTMNYAFNMLNDNIAVIVKELIGAYAAILPFTDYNG